jgi:hypothetical protein
MTSRDNRKVKERGREKMWEWVGNGVLGVKEETKV